MSKDQSKTAKKKKSKKRGGSASAKLEGRGERSGRIQQRLVRTSKSRAGNKIMGAAIATSATSEASRPCETLRVGKRYTVVIPRKLRAALGISEGDTLVATVDGARLVLEPAEVVARPVVSRERLAELLLGSADTREEYEAAREEVRELGIDPNDVPHTTPDDE